MNDVTRLLQAIEAGSATAADELLPLVYGDLKRLARGKMVSERAGQTLQPTALVHEAYLRLFDARGTVNFFQNRRHFFAAAAEAMRRILVENARRKHCEKRGSGAANAEFDDAEFSVTSSHEEIIAVHEVLDLLAEESGTAAEVVKLHFFAGLQWQECADIMGVDERTTRRYWSFARAWLYDKLGQQRIAV